MSDQVIPEYDIDFDSEQDAQVLDRMAHYVRQMKRKDWRLGHLHVIYRGNMPLGDDYGIVTWGHGRDRTLDLLAGTRMLTIRWDHEW